MKNIILIDRSLLYVETFIKRSYHIVVLVVDSDAMAQECRQKYKDNPHITHILSMQELEYVDGVEWLDFDLIQTYKNTQCEVEFVAHRWLNDGMLATNKYLNALCWWNRIFDTHTIDFVLVADLKHGHNYDIPLYIATHRKIPAFVTPPTIVLYAISLMLYNTQTYLPIRDTRTIKEDIKQNLFCSFDKDTAPSFTLNTYSLKRKIEVYIARGIYALGGQLGIDFVNGIRKRSFSMRQHVGNFPTSFWIKLKNYIYLKKQKKYYNAISQIPDYTEKFIFYAIHFEPEAKTSVCVPLQNQLTIIQMLSRALPDGYKLYIKEHPVQFKLNNAQRSYYLYNIKWFKSIEFYKEIQKLNNVVFVDLHTSSKELITYARAVATINGTAHLESTFLNKICIVFGGKNILLRNAKNIIYVESFKTLKDGLYDIEHNPQKFDNALQIEKYEQYLCAYCVPVKNLSFGGGQL